MACGLLTQAFEELCPPNHPDYPESQRVMKKITKYFEAILVNMQYSEDDGKIEAQVILAIEEALNSTLKRNKVWGPGLSLATNWQLLFSKL